MTEHTALRVANAVCETQRKAAALIIATGVESERVEFHNSCDGEQSCSLSVDGEFACMVSWWEVDKDHVEVRLDWTLDWDARLDAAHA